MNNRMYLKNKRLQWFLTILIIASHLLISCSNDGPTNSDNNPDPLAVTVSPATGPPLTVVEITGLTTGSHNVDSLVVTFDGTLTNLSVDSLGKFRTTVPISIDSTTHWLDTTDISYDITVYDINTGDTVAFGGSVFTSTDIPRANGTVGNMIISIQAISSSLKIISQSFITEPGYEEMIMMGSLESLDSLIGSSDSLSLLSAFIDLQTNSPEFLPLLDALLASSGLAEHAASYATAFTDMAALTTPAPKLEASNSSLSTIIMADTEIARRMQTYVVIRDFGKEVLAPTSSQFGLFMSVVGLSGKVPKFLSALNAILSIVSFTVTKLFVGVFPAKIDSLTLGFVNDTIASGDVTESDKYIYVSNDPPSISVLDITGLIVTSLGLTKTVLPENLATQNRTLATELKAIEEMIDFFLGMIRTTFGIYADFNGHVDLDPNITELPDIDWKGELVTAFLLELFTLSPDVINTFPGVPNLNIEWKADGPSSGEARIFYMTNSNPDFAVAPPPSVNYHYGVFGEDNGRSPDDTIWVEESHIRLTGRVVESTDTSYVATVIIFIFDIDENQDTIPIPNTIVNLSMTGDGFYPPPLEPTSGITDSSGKFEFGGLFTWKTHDWPPPPYQLLHLQASTPDGNLYEEVVILSP